MWFDELMDDCKQALALVWANIWIALPYVIHTVVTVVGVFIAVFGFIFLFIFLVASTFGRPDPGMGWLVVLLIFLIAGAVFAVIASAIKAMVEAGSISLFAAVADGHKPSAALFWSGVRTHFLSMWGITLFLSLAGVLLSPILFILLALFGLGGLLTAGWGTLAIPVLLTVFLGAWPIALVLEGKGGFSALGAGFRLGKRYFWGLCVLGLAATLIAPQLSTAFGPLVTILIGWVLALVIRAWQKMTILLIYRRHMQGRAGVV